MAYHYNSNAIHDSFLSGIQIKCIGTSLIHLVEKKHPHFPNLLRAYTEGSKSYVYR